MADKPTTPSIPKRPPALQPVALKRADLERGNYIAIVPSTTTFDDVMTPAFWQHHVRALGDRPFARVEVVREDGTMDLDLRVLKAAPGMVVMRCLRKHLDDSNIATAAADKADDPAVDLSLPDGYKWAHVPKGQNAGHMIRLPTGDVLVQGLPSKAAACARAREHFALASRPATEVTPPAPATV